MPLGRALPRALAAAGIAAVGVASSSGAPMSKGPPREAALVSERTGKVLRRFSTRLTTMDPGYDTGPGPVLPGGDAVPDGHGAWFVAGIGLRRMQNDGRLDRKWRAQLPTRRPLSGLARVGTTLYLNDGYRVYSLSARTGALLWRSQRIHAGTDIGILAQAATRSAVYVGGYFERVGTARRSKLAALDARTGHLLPWRAPALGSYKGSSPNVSGLDVSRGRLYVVGSFVRVGGFARPDGAAALRLSDGSPTPFAPKLHMDEVVAMTVSGPLVLFGGRPLELSGRREGGGAFDAETGARRRTSPLVSNASAITLHGSTVYLGFTLRTIVGDQYLFALDRRTWKVKRWFPNLARYIYSAAPIGVVGGKVFVAGQFCSTLG